MPKYKFKAKFETKTLKGKFDGQTKAESADLAVVQVIRNAAKQIGIPAECISVISVTEKKPKKGA